MKETLYFTFLSFTPAVEWYTNVRSTAVFVIIMKYTQKIQNKPTQVILVVHNADAFFAEAAR